MYAKSIQYDREVRDYAMYLDGELTGFARSYHAAEIALDQLVYELLIGGASHTATEMDGSAVPGEHCCANCGALLHCNCDDAAYRGSDAGVMAADSAAGLADPPVDDPLPDQPGEPYPGVDYEEERRPLPISV